MSIETMEMDTVEKIAAIPIEQIDVSRPSLFQKDTIGLFFDRLRKEEPVHYCRESKVGPYWSVTRFDDIMAVDTNHKVFSSEAKLERPLPLQSRRQTCSYLSRQSVNVRAISSMICR